MTIPREASRNIEVLGQRSFQERLPEMQNPSGSNVSNYFPGCIRYRATIFPSSSRAASAIRQQSFQSDSFQTASAIRVLDIRIPSRDLGRPRLLTVAALQFGACSFAIGPRGLCLGLQRFRRLFLQVGRATARMRYHPRRLCIPTESNHFRGRDSSTWALPVGWESSASAIGHQPATVAPEAAREGLNVSVGAVVEG